MLILDRAVVNTMKVIRNKEGHYTMIKESILQEGITILKVYAPSSRASDYKR